MLEEFWKQYEMFSSNVSRSRYKLFSNNLRRWFALLDGERLIAPLIKQLETSMDFDAWYAAQEATQGSMAGSADLDFPLETKNRLGAYLYLFRKMAADDGVAPNFANTFLGSDNDFDSMVTDVTRDLFDPFEVEFSEYVRRTLEAPQTDSDSVRTAPASDRVVTLNHNSTAYSEAIEALNRVRDAVAESNEYGDLGDKGQRIAELNASRVLLDAPQVRISLVQELTVRCLKYLGNKFVDGVIGTLVTAAIVALAAVFGFHVLM